VTASAESHFRQVDEFIGATGGKKAQRMYSIVIGDPQQAAKEIRSSLDELAEPLARVVD